MTAAAGRTDAAVLVPVYRPAGGDLTMVLVRRTDGGIHGGQIAFPGGKREAGDASMLETALRETGEEIGLGAGDLEVLGALPVAETLTTGFRVHPFLACIAPPPRWRPDRDEIAEVIETGVEALARTENRGRVRKSFPTWPVPREIPYLRVGEHRLWGLTYRIVEPLLPRLLAGEWPI